MRALTLHNTTVTLQTNHPLPTLAPNEALIQVRLAGLCQTDLELARGYMHFAGTLGHEFVGTVVRTANPAHSHWIGKRVCGEINCPCGSCPLCTRGLTTHCPHRTVLGILHHDGAFADFLRLPVANLHAIPDSVSDDQAVFVEPLAAAFQILEQVPVTPATKTLVLGDGRLGQLVAQVLHLTGCNLTLIGRHEHKLQIARNRGIHATLDQALPTTRDADLVVDCTGRAEGFHRALQLVRPRGTLILKTTVAGTPPINLAPLVIDEITLIGSRCGPFAKAIQALESHQIDVLPLISQRLPLEQAPTLFQPQPTPNPTLLKTLIQL